MVCGGFNVGFYYLQIVACLQLDDRRTDSAAVEVVVVGHGSIHVHYYCCCCAD